MHSYLKKHFFHIFHTKKVAKLIYKILMPGDLKSHILKSSADHIVGDNIDTYGID